MTCARVIHALPPSGALCLCRKEAAVGVCHYQETSGFPLLTFDRYCFSCLLDLPRRRIERQENARAREKVETEDRRRHWGRF